MLQRCLLDTRTMRYLVRSKYELQSSCLELRSLSFAKSYVDNMSSSSYIYNNCQLNYNS